MGNQASGEPAASSWISYVSDPKSHRSQVSWNDGLRR